MEIYYNDTTPTDSELVYEIIRVINLYDEQLDDGNFMLLAPKSVYDEVVLNGPKGLNKYRRNIIDYNSDKYYILLIDTLLANNQQSYISKNEAELRVSKLTHRLVTKEFYDLLPEVSIIKTKFSEINNRMFNEWNGNQDIMLKIICLIENFKNGYYKYPPATYREKLEYIKDFFIRFVGEDHIATLLNMMNSFENAIDKDRWLLENSISENFKEAYANYSYLTRILRINANAPIDMNEVKQHIRKYYPTATKSDNVYIMNNETYIINETILVSALYATEPEQITIISYVNVDDSLPKLIQIAI